VSGNLTGHYGNTCVYGHFYVTTSVPDGDRGSLRNVGTLLRTDEAGRPLALELQYSVYTRMPKGECPGRFPSMCTVRLHGIGTILVRQPASDSVRSKGSEDNSLINSFSATNEISRLKTVFLPVV